MYFYDVKLLNITYYLINYLMLFHSIFKCLKTGVFKEVKNNKNMEGNKEN